MATCELYLQARNQARRRVVKRRRWRSNCAKRAREPPSNPPEVKEFAGFASARAADPTSLSEPLQLRANFDWIADTGATSHMEYFTLPPESSTDTSTGLGTDWSLLAPVLTEKTPSRILFLLEKNLSHYWHQY